jgi:hypothetical protein
MGGCRWQVAELARQVRVQMAAEGEPPPLGMIDRYIRTHVRQWEEHLPGKIRWTPERGIPHDKRRDGIMQTFDTEDAV